MGSLKLAAILLLLGSPVLVSSALAQSAPLWLGAHSLRRRNPRQGYQHQFHGGGTPSGPRHPQGRRKGL